MFALPNISSGSGGVKSVQRGSAIPNPSLVVTISKVDTSKSFLIINTNADSGTGAKTVTGIISSATSITFSNGAAASVANWEVVEFN